MVDFYWRADKPAGGVYDGRSYQTAWFKGNHPSQMTSPGCVDLDAMQPGDTLKVSGVHTSFPANVLQVRRSGITVRGDDLSPAVLLGGYVALIDVTGVTVEDLHIVGKTDFSQGVAINGSNHCAVQRVWIESVYNAIIAPRGKTSNFNKILDNHIDRAEQGISLYAYSHKTDDVKKGWQISGNLIERVGDVPEYSSQDREAIGIQGAVDITVARNVIRDCVYGIHLWACEYAIVEGVTIQDNVLSEIRGGEAFWPSHAIMKSCSNADHHCGVVIEGNVVLGCDGYGVRWNTTPGSSYTIVRNNRIAQTLGMQTSGNVLHENNLVY